MWIRKTLWVQAVKGKFGGIYIGRKHVVFGKVVDGMDVLNKIEQCPTGERDRPDKPIKVLSSGEVSRGKSNGVIENGKWQNDS